MCRVTRNNRADFLLRVGQILAGGVELCVLFRSTRSSRRHFAMKDVGDGFGLKYAFDMRLK